VKTEVVIGEVSGGRKGTRSFLPRKSLSRTTAPGVKKDMSALKMAQGLETVECAEKRTVGLKEGSQAGEEAGARMGEKGGSLAEIISLGVFRGQGDIRKKKIFFLA